MHEKIQLFDVAFLKVRPCRTLACQLHYSRLNPWPTPSLIFVDRIDHVEIEVTKDDK